MSFANPLPAGIRQVVPDYVSDGVTTTFGFPFRLWQAADLFVGWSAPPAAGVALPLPNASFTPLLLGQDYQVTINGVASATVTLTVPQASANLIRVSGLRTPARTTSVVNDGVLQSVPFESELDVVEATLQEVRRDVSNETLRAIDGESLLAAEIAALQAQFAAVQAAINANLLEYLTANILSLPTSPPATPGFWNDGGVVCVVSGQVLGLSTTLPGVANQLWDNGGVVCIS